MKVKDGFEKLNDSDGFKKTEEKARHLSTFWLAIGNLRRRPSRSVALASLAAIAAFVLFASTILTAGMKNGLGSLKARLGADLLVVPVGYDKGLEGILLKGEPAYFYFDKEVEEKIKGVQGVKEVSAQFFLTSANQDCCAVPVQFIGFDPKSDFSIQPWIEKSYSKSIKDGELVIGRDITLGENRELRFFGKNYLVAATLEKTGTSLDQAVYANMNTLFDLFAAAKDRGLKFTKNIDPTKSISSVLVRLEDGFTADEVTHNIRASFDGLQVIKSKSMVSSLAGNMQIFIVFLYVFSALFFVAALISLFVVFLLLANERKKEFAVLRSLGASSKKLAALVLTESALVCAIGGVAGTALSAAAIIPFSALIAKALRLPCLLPSVWTIFVSALLCVGLSLALGPAAAALEAVRAGRRELVYLIKDGE